MTIEEEMVPVAPLAVLYDPESHVLRVRFTNNEVQYKQFMAGGVKHIDKQHRVVLIEFIGVNLEIDQQATAGHSG